jgi:hypothetical protein
MENLIPSLIVIALCGVIIIAIFWLVNRNKVQQEQKIQEIASLRGWEYAAIREPLRSGYRLSGKHRGTDWVLEGIDEASGREAGPGSSEVSSTTCWQCQPAPLPGGMVAVGLRPSQNTAALSAAMSNTLIHAALRLMLGSQAGAVSSLKEVPAGSESFRQRFMVWAHDEQDANRLISSDTESALMAWPENLPVIIKLGPLGLEILHNKARLTKPAEINQLVELGCRLIDAWQSRNEY